MARGDGETDVYDLSGNGMGVALNVYPDTGSPAVFDTIADFPITGNPDIIYIDNSTGDAYYWDEETGTYVEFSGLTDGDLGDVVVSDSGNSFTVESATPADGSFNVTGDLDVTGTVTAPNVTVSGTLTTADLTVTDDLTITDDVTIQSDLTVNGDTFLGNAAADTVTIQGNIVQQNTAANVYHFMGPGTDVFSVLEMRGQGNSPTKGLTITAGNDAALFDAGTYTFRGIGAPGTFLTLDATFATFNKQIVAVNGIGANSLVIRAAGTGVVSGALERTGTDLAVTATAKIYFGAYPFVLNGWGNIDVNGLTIHGNVNAEDIIYISGAGPTLVLEDTDSATTAINGAISWLDSTPTTRAQIRRTGDGHLYYDNTDGSHIFRIAGTAGLTVASGGITLANSLQVNAASISVRSNSSTIDIWDLDGATTLSQGAFRMIGSGGTVRTEMSKNGSGEFVIQHLDGNIAFNTAALTTKFLIAPTVVTSKVNFTVEGQTLYVNTDKMFMQHNGSNGYLRTAASAGSLYLGSNGANIIEITTAGNVLISTGLLGYETGGAVVQATSKSTGVTLNGPSGKITMHNASLAANTVIGFVLTNSFIATDSVVLLTIASGAAGGGSYIVSCDALTAGTARINLRNMTAGALGEAVVINFVVIKAKVS